jgi:hypothetical protein
VTLDTTKIALFGPAAVTIHNDGQVLRQLLKGDLFRSRLVGNCIFFRQIRNSNHFLFNHKQPGPLVQVNPARGGIAVKDGELFWSTGGIEITNHKLQISNKSQ